jgi:hypothetical protein
MSNHIAVLQDEESEEEQQKPSHTRTPKLPLVYVTAVRNVSPLIQRLEQIARDNQVTPLNTAAYL